MIQYENAKKWVLVVDDDPDIREIMADTILSRVKDFNVKVVEAKDGSEAEQKLCHQTFDLIVTDLNMPLVDGLALMTLVEQSELNSNTPMIVVTGFPSQEATLRRPHAIALLKPFDKSSLLNAVHSQLQLGRVDSRVPAHLLNPFLEALHSFSSSHLKKPPSQGKALLKKHGSLMPGEVFCSLRIQIGHVRSLIVIGFDKNLALQLHRGGHLGSPESLLETIKGCGQEIFRLMAEVIFSQDGRRPELAGLEVFEDQSDPFLVDLKNGKGLVIPMDTGRGKIYVEAIAPRKMGRVPTMKAS